jgi:anti-sigma factor RsiW
MTDCLQVRELLGLRLYGELEPDDALALERHLATCAACTADFRELDRGLGALHRAEAALQAGSPDLRAFEARLERALRLRTWRQAAAAAAIFLAGLGAGVLLPRTRAAQAASLAEPPAPSRGTFAREDLPPPASTRGLLAQIARQPG